MKTTKLAIFVTGGGTNCENIIKYFQDKPEVEIPIVVSSKEDAYAIVRAQNLGIKTTVITRQQLNEDTELVLNTVKGCDYIILAGFLPKVPVYLIDPQPVSTSVEGITFLRKKASEGMEELTQLLCGR